MFLKYIKVFNASNILKNTIFLDTTYFLLVSYYLNIPIIQIINSRFFFLFFKKK